MANDTSTAYDVFISYKREDELHALALHAALEASGYSVFRDVDGLTLAKNVNEEMPLHLKRARSVVVLWSELAAKSEWVLAEASYAWVERKYIPLLVPGSTGGAIPAKFRDYTAKQLADVIVDIQPLANAIAAIHLPSAERDTLKTNMPASGGEYLIGREAEMAALDAAWGKTRLFVFDAMGGTGKTALINAFMQAMADQNWRGAERVFAWSFYSQGTDDKRQGDADGFFTEALAKFGYKGEPITSATRRGETLAGLINAKKTLLVLDGLEPLQYPANSPGLEGKLKDDGLAALFKRLALQMNGMAIVTTRIPIPDLKGTTAPAVEKRELNQLKTQHGVTLLKMLGVKAGDKDLAETVDLLRTRAQPQLAGDV